MGESRAQEAKIHLPRQYIIFDKMHAQNSQTCLAKLTEPPPRETCDPATEKYR